MMQNYNKANSAFYAILEKRGYSIPDYIGTEPPMLTKPADLLQLYRDDILGGGARRFECLSNYLWTGKLERAKPLGAADIVVKRGVTLECKSGHGWLIEPRFCSREELDSWIEERSNPMVRASHVMYLPTRALGVFNEVYDARILTAKAFWNIFQSFGKTCPKENRGYWGVAMKPWLRREDGYTVSNSKKTYDLIHAQIEAEGVTVWEFAETLGIGLHEDF